MLIEFLIGSLIIGMIRGGKIGRLRYISFNRISILILSLLIYMSYFHFAFRGYNIIMNYTIRLYIFSYVMLIIGLVLNYRFRESWLMFIGVIMNLISFFANGRKLLVSIEGLKYTGLNDAVNLIANQNMSLFAPISEATKYSFLSRLIALPQPYPYPQIFSLGDFVISLGLFLLIQRIMFDERIERNSLINFK